LLQAPIRGENAAVEQMLLHVLGVDRRPLPGAEHKNARGNEKRDLDGENNRNVASKRVSKHRSILAAGNAGGLDLDQVYFRPAQSVAPNMAAM